MTMIKLIAAAAITVAFGFNLATTMIAATIVIVIAKMMMTMIMTSIGNIAAGTATATVHVVGKTAIAFRSDRFGSAHDLVDLKAVLLIAERGVRRGERWTSLFFI